MARVLNDLFAQVVELARQVWAAWDTWVSTRRASRNRIDTEQGLRDARARIRRDIRRWQKQCDADDPNEGAGLEVHREAMARLEQQLQEIPERMERLRKSGLKKLSRSDASQPIAGFLLVCIGKEVSEVAKGELLGHRKFRSSAGRTLRANIPETPVVLLINEQGEKEKGRYEFSWCCSFQSSFQPAGVCSLLRHLIQFFLCGGRGGIELDRLQII
jgi:hypothetical protein